MEIKQLREALGLSQSQFASKFGFSTKTLQNWEINRTKTPDYVIGMVKELLRLYKKTGEIQ